MATGSAPAGATGHGNVEGTRSMRITITCEDCGQRHPLERRVAEPGEIWIVCHGCETPLRAVYEASGTTAGTAAETRLRTPFAAVWGGTLDLATGTGSGAAG